MARALFIAGVAAALSCFHCAHRENVEPVAPEALVHIEGAADMSLEATVEDEGFVRTGRVVCPAPCDVTLPTSDAYRLSGGVSFSSRTFMLRPRDDGRASVLVKPGSIPLYALGVTLLLAGIATSSYGLLVAFPPPVDGGGDSVSAAALATGLALQGVGTAVAVAGGFMMGGNRRTWVSGDIVWNLLPTPRAVARLPAGTEAPAPVPLPPAFVTPVLSASF